MKSIGRVEITKMINKVESITCDLCGKEAKGDSWQEGVYIDPDEFYLASHNVNITICYEETGIHHNGGISKRIIDIDMCPTCFIGRFIIWLEKESNTRIEAKRHEDGCV